jgi:outer membrane lipoprotein-sorting protein
MKRLGMILSLATILATMTSCTKEELQEIAANNKACTLDFDQQMADFQQRLENGTHEDG